MYRDEMVSDKREEDDIWSFDRRDMSTLITGLYDLCLCPSYTPAVGMFVLYNHNNFAAVVLSRAFLLSGRHRGARPVHSEATSRTEVFATTLPDPIPEGE